MAPAIAHFLVGASIVLLFAAPFALRYGVDQNRLLWLVAAGGLWGLAPDVHHVVPVYRDRVEGVHDSPWSDLFGLHYTLDHPAARELYLESIFGAILLFFVAVAAFSASNRVREREVVVETDLERLLVSSYALGAASAYAGFAVGLLLRGTAQLETVALLVGYRHPVVGGVLLVPLSLAGGAAIAILLERLVFRQYPVTPRTGALAGLAAGLLSWGTGVAFLIPLWLRLLGVYRPVPYAHWGTLPGFVAFGVVFGVAYAAVRGAFSSAPRGRPGAVDRERPG